MGQYANYAIAAGKLAVGLSSRSSAFDEAKALQRRAGQSRAAAQRAAQEERKRAELLISTARARAAAGGGSTADEGVVNLLAQIDAQGEMNALTRLWEGEIDARSDEDSAAITKRQGNAGMLASTLSAIDTAAGPTFASKYGDSFTSVPASTARRRSVNAIPGGFNPGDFYDG